MSCSSEMRDKETSRPPFEPRDRPPRVRLPRPPGRPRRIYDLFEEGEVHQIRKLLAYNIRAIIYQKLLPTLHDHIPRIPALEVLLGSPIVQKFILEAREGELLEVIKRSQKEGMIDFTSSLVSLVEEEMIHHKVAIDATPKPEELKMRLKGIS